MRKVITILSLVFLLSFSIFAQDKDEKETIECPEISITGPASTVAMGEPMPFTLTIWGEYDAKDVSITWSVEKGTIIKGQGTKTLLVKQLGNAETTLVTANVLIGNCNLSASEAGVTVCLPMPMLFDEFGKTSNGDVKARIDAFITELQNNPNSQGYIINYGSKGDVSRRERLIRNSINIRSYDISRITYVNGGEEKQIRTRLWLVPLGADDSTID